MIKVLVVDDSLMFRRMISRGLAADSEIQVVATAGDAYQARDMIVRFNPDVMTLDVEMPRMNGIDFLKKLMPQHPIPTIMISSLNKKVFEALDAGAVDFVDKPVHNGTEEIAKWVFEELIAKVKAAAGATRIGIREEKKIQKVAYVEREYKDKVLAIGASTGGTEAICEVVKGFHTNIPGTVVVQHMPPGFTKMYADRLDHQCEVNVKEAQDGDLVEQGKVLIAPGDKHMRLVRTGGIYRVEVRAGEKVSGHCPSVDVLFESVARAAASNAVGVILTGMGADGARGLLSMRKRGAKTIGQDAKSCVVYGMPKVAYDVGAVERQVPVDNIARVIYNVFNSMP